MNRKPPLPALQKKRRTTLTLPNDSLLQAEQIARFRKVNLSTVVSEALAEGLRLNSAAARSQQALVEYRNPFSGFSDDEMAILDGIILEPIPET
jgi:hypothetical protein